MARPPMPRSMTQMLGRSVNIATTGVVRSIERKGAGSTGKGRSSVRGAGDTAYAFGTWYTDPSPDLVWSAVAGFTFTETGALLVDVAGFYAVQIVCRMQSASPGTPVAVALISGGGTYDRFDATTDGGGEYKDGLSAFMELESSGVGFGPQFAGTTDVDEFGESTFTVTATLLTTT